MHATFEHDGRTTRAHVESEFHEFTGEGVARCRPEDHYVPGIGERIATGRAIQDLGRQIEEEYLAASITQMQWEAQQVGDAAGAKADALNQVVNDIVAHPATVAL